MGEELTLEALEDLPRGAVVVDPGTQVAWQAQGAPHSPDRCWRSTQGGAGSSGNLVQAGVVLAWVPPRRPGSHARLGEGGAQW